MQKSVFSLKKSVVALAVLSVSGVGVAQDASSSLVPSHLSVSQVGTTLESGKYGEAINNQVLDNLKTELELLTLNSLSKIAYNGVHANGIYRGASQQKLFEFFYKGTVSDLPNGVKVMEKIRNGNIFDTKELAEKTIEILKQRDSSSRALNLMEGFAKGLNIDTKDGALIASLANQFIINQKLQELTVGSHKQLKLDIGRLDDVVKGQGEEIDILQFGLEDAILSVEGNSNQIAEVSYDLADLQSEVEYTTSTMREDIAEAHEAIVLLDRADEIQFERLNEIAKVNEEINYRQDSQLREKADKSALMGLERLVVKNISGIEKNAEGLVQLGNEVSSGFKKAQTALTELSVEVEEGFNRTGKAVNALKEKEVEQDKRLNVVEFGVGTLVEAVQGKADNSTVRALDERIQKSNEEIKLVQQAVGINALGVMNNKMAISELDRRVAKVSREMQKGLAAQSALSQLSPSSNRVGKVNMSAAVGFYNGNSALAIGTGYRVNEGFSARAGFALSGGDVSGGAGINYEW
ncbi:hypothetical protein A4A71_00330 [Nicoletella semolina]|nr:YadA C-terminal domain-containing protein [Nicoletella semolina]MDH2923824.1 hypothetical protein [Nicoletella semolina]